VHLALASIDLNAGEAALARTVHAHGRAIGAATDEVAAATGVVRRVLEHPLLREAAASLEIRREVPVVLDLASLGGGATGLGEGVVDLAFRNAEGWTVVDFKTDAELSRREATYRRQVGLYAAAVAGATRGPVRSFLLIV
jgi:ATP-dependent exoDNAse (exonuclease V) beta subunit